MITKIHTCCIVFICLLSHVNTNAQDLFHVSYDWDSLPAAPPPDSLRTQKAVLLKDLRVVDYYTESNSTISRYKTYHTIIWVNDHSTADRFNKLYIPIRPGNKLLYVKARTVNPQGTFTEYTNGGSLQHLTNVEGYGNFDVFAIEGVQVGGMIEYIYTVRETNNYFGREVFQTDMPVMNAELRVYYPDYLSYISKSYNGFAAVTTDVKSTGGKRMLQAAQNYLPALVEEEYSAYQSCLARIEYKLSENTSLGEFEMFDFDKAAYQYWNYLHDDEIKGLRKTKELLGEWGVIAETDLDKRVQKINSKILAQFSLVNGQSPELEELDKVCANKFGNALGLQRLYVALLEAAGVDFQIVFTTNRFEYAFDKSFESWLQLDACLLYFPFSKKYIEPNNLLSIYGPPSYELAENDGLFISKKGEEIIGEIHHIELPDETYNTTEMDISVDLINGWQKAIVNQKLLSSGYDALTDRFIYQYATPDKREEYLRSKILSTGIDVQIDSFRADKTALDFSYSNTPFEISARTYQSSLLEFAGNNLLFAIGELIGEQNELYVRSNRKCPVEFRHPLQYKRSIHFKVPAGYAIKNPDALNMQVVMPDSSCGFISSYTLDENQQLTVSITEYYKQAHYEPFQFLNFRNVINAAADFNKIHLVLVKE